MDILGGKTQTIFLKGIESHKLHHSFEAAAAIKQGQPVKLNAAGMAVPAVADDKSHVVIGHSVHNAATGEELTVGMKAYGVVWASPNAAVDAGPVKYAGLNATDDSYNAYLAASVDGSDLVGWALDQATGADDMIRVAIL